VDPLKKLAAFLIFFYKNKTYIKMKLYRTVTTELENTLHNRSANSHTVHNYGQVER